MFKIKRRKIGIFLKLGFALSYWPLLLYIVFYSSMVQQYLGQKATNYLSEKLNTTVQVGGLDYSLFNTVILKDLYIEDLAQDTLLAVNRFSLVVDLTKLDFDKQIIHLERIVLYKMALNLSRTENGDMNFQFLVDAFSTDTVPTDSLSGSLAYKCSDIDIVDSDIKYFDNEVASVNYGMNFGDLHFKNTTLNLRNLAIIGDSILFDLDKIAFREKSGFTLFGISSKDNIISNKKIQFNDLRFKTLNSKFYAKKLLLNYSSYDAFSDFINKVEMDIYLLDSTKIGVKDISYFVPELKNLDISLFVGAKINGYVNDLTIRDLRIKYGQNTGLLSNIYVSGLPNINNTFLDINIKYLSTSKNDLVSLPDIETGEKQLINLPEQLANLGNISYSGEITGFLNDFTAIGKITSNLGDISTDIQVKNDTIKYERQILGKIEGEFLAINKLLNDNQFGAFSFKNDIELSIFNNERISATTNTVVSSFIVNNYEYRDLLIDGELTEEMFYGTIKIDDPNLNANFLGGFDFSKDIPEFNFSLNVPKINFQKLNLLSDSSAFISLVMSANFIGTDINQMDGNINLFLNKLVFNKKIIDFSQIQISAKPGKKDSTRVLELNSDFGVIILRGKYNLLEISDYFSSLTERHLPALAPVSKLDTASLFNTHNDFTFSIKLKNTVPLTEMFFPELRLSPLIISGLYNSQKDLSFIFAKAKYISIYDNEFHQIKINGSATADEILFDMDNSHVNRGDFIFRELSLHVKARKDTLFSVFEWINLDDSIPNSGQFALDLMLQRDSTAMSPDLFLKMRPSVVMIDTATWFFNQAFVHIDTLFNIDIQDFEMNNQEQQFWMEGRITKDPADTLKIYFSNFELNNFNLFTEELGVHLSGHLSGSTNLMNLLEKPLFYSQNEILGFSLNNQALGDLSLDAYWDKENDQLNLKAESKLHRIRPIYLSGSYKPATDSIQLDAEIQAIQMRMFSPFVEGMLSGLTGKIYGKASINGTLDKIRIDAGLKFMRTAFTIDYLQTRYNLTDSVHIRNNQIEFDKMKLNSGRNSYALISGAVRHQNFENIQLDIGVEAHNFLFLNSFETDSAFFYGKAYASGDIFVKGTPDNMIVDIAVKTEKNTQLFIPLTTSSTVADQNSFINFVNTDKQAYEKEKEYEVNLSGMQLNFDFDITTDAEVQIILDEKVGDIIKARGMGNLKMNINTLGDFNMYGDLVIYKGDYLFTLQNIINKKFEIEKGGVIAWNGDPYNAILDLKAIYRIRKVPLFDLMLEDQYIDKKIPVNCGLSMSENLMQPNIQFHLDLPTADDNIKQQVNNLTKDALNKQLLSLLIMNKFQPLPGLTSSQELFSNDYVGNNITELLSNQLSNWLSKISDDFDIGINYQLGDEVSSDELEVALSTQVFNERVSINANFGVGGENLDAAQNQSSSQTTNLVGDISVDVKVNKTGSMRVKAFTRTNENDNLNADNTSYTQGLGVFYRKDFDTFGELFLDFWNVISFKNWRNKKNTRSRKGKKIKF